MEQAPIQIGQFILGKNLGIGAFGKVRVVYESFHPCGVVTLAVTPTQTLVSKLEYDCSCREHVQSASVGCHRLGWDHGTDLLEGAYAIVLLWVIRLSPSRSFIVTFCLRTRGWPISPYPRRQGQTGDSCGDRT